MEPLGAEAVGHPGLFRIWITKEKGLNVKPGFHKANLDHDNDQF